MAGHGEFRECLVGIFKMFLAREQLIATFKACKMPFQCVVKKQMSARSGDIG
jgi:hypothetical protein